MSGHEGNTGRNDHGRPTGHEETTDHGRPAVPGGGAGPTEPAAHAGPAHPGRPPAGPDGDTGDADLPPLPADFALRVLRRAGVPRERYDTYASLDTPAGPLFVAAAPDTVTGSALGGAGLTPTRFEELHRARTGRSAISVPKPFPGLVTALRTGRARNLPLDLGPEDTPTARVLTAVRTVPPGQLRPLSWIAREAGAGTTDPPPDPAALIGVLAANPFPVLVPCHRITYDNGAPCDAGHLPALGDALRTAEGVDMAEVRRWASGGSVFLGSATTNIYCHPTCGHARRITAPHRVPFATARDARRAGYRACKSCRPLTV
ncbi:Ada metal-binding domain-containing protein (plasmid) [Streptomyces sp. BI20]|uniref:Ada metal-binding domain-containing protein n=1 Tax=Streptomyces sp. BI20 TaxID=3403460 RepID=UPI003C7867F9